MDIEIDSQEKNNLTMDEIQALKGLLQSYPIHNHDGRNSLEVATSRVKKAMDAYKIILPTAATMGEDADDGNAVRIGKEGADSGLRLTASQTLMDLGVYWDMYHNVYPNQCQAAQSFKIINSKMGEKIRCVVLYLNFSMGEKIRCVVDICSDNNGIPGEVLATSIPYTYDPAFYYEGELSFYFDENDLILEPNTLYWIKFRVSSSHYLSFLFIYYWPFFNNYAYGQSKASGDYGATWSNLGYDLYFKIYLGDTNGRVYKATAESDAVVNRYVGILDGAYTSGQTPRIIAKGVKSNYSDLAPGSVYYLTNTPGIISTAPGTITKQVAVAIDKNNLLIL